MTHLDDAHTEPIIDDTLGSEYCGPLGNESVDNRSNSTADTNPSQQIGLIEFRS